jgi:hypothetical protein
MGAKLREALVQAAHLIADAIEAEREGAPERQRKAVKTRSRSRSSRQPTGRPMSELDIARAREAARRAGIPIP